MRNKDLKAGDKVLVQPMANDMLNHEFQGTVIGWNEGKWLQVRDQDDEVWDCNPDYVEELEPEVDKIQRFTCQTKAGNTLQLFYNPDNDLVVVDLIAKNDKGGNEILRKTLDEKQLLKHTK